MKDIAHASLLRMGSYQGLTLANSNMIDTFNNSLSGLGLPEITTSIRQIAIEAEAGQTLTINEKIEVTMPSTGILEIPLDYYQIYSLEFTEVTTVNIVYFY